ncbi:MAG: phage minor capsid protein [Bacteroidales bacterium]|nr:phage minor capsid protein [Clostridium sp.]MCM1204740.1 phage minor capsid protein [Bacteroidales bacterium]
MLTENQYEVLGDRIAELYQALEQDVIADIARRIKKTGRLTETAELMAKAMMDKGTSPAKIRTEVMKLLRADPAYRKEVANNTKQYKWDTIHKIRETEKRAREMGNLLIAEAGNMSYNKDLWLWHQAGKELTKDSAFAELVESMAEATANTLRNLTLTTGFKGLHGYTSIMNAYTNALDKALIKMTSGAFSFDRAAEDCVRELARSGLRKIDYASGRSYNLDTAARMCLRTASGQLAARISMKHCDDMETDLVEVDSHWGARPEHAAWQGKVYSRSGNNKKYPDFALCGYGEASGLCGPNCRHTFYPFFEGISIPNTWEPEPEPKDYNGKRYTYYEATQKQRQMERDIRAVKGEIEATRIMGGDTKALEAKKRAQIKKYHEFSDAMGISAKDNRLRVVKGSRDVTRTQTYKHISGERTKKEIAKSLFNVQPRLKGDVVSEIKLYKELRKTDIGFDVLKYIEVNKISVDILYDKEAISGAGLKGNYGICYQKSIYINAVACNTLKRIAETIIHETIHIKYDIGGDQHAECVCEYYANKHRKGSLTAEDIKGIIKSVKERYPDLKWREKV